MAISMVRKPSATPNINNIDDIIPFRYAYGNQNGYVIGRGAEVSHTVNGNQFTINSGRLVIQGVESDIDANGVTLTIDSVNETRYYVVYYEINLATNTANIKLSNYSTTGYPTISAGDDLTVNSTGIARLPLYRFTAKGGVISGIEKVVSSVKYLKEFVEDTTVKHSVSSDFSAQAESSNSSNKSSVLDINVSNISNGFKSVNFSQGIANIYLEKGVYLICVGFKNNNNIFSLSSCVLIISNYSFSNSSIFINDNDNGYNYITYSSETLIINSSNQQKNDGVIYYKKISL